MPPDDPSKQADTPPPAPPVGPTSPPPTRVELVGAQSVTPAQPSVKDLDPLAKAGVLLAKFVLWTVALSIATVFGLFVFVELSASPELTAASAKLAAQAAALKPESPEFQQMAATLARIEEHKKDARAHLMNVSQMILLNLLLPVLTAILGYIFGTQRASTNS
jgi:hypothetical protein